MGWLRDYLWLNSSQLINGYNPFGMNSLSVWAWMFLFGHLVWATGFMFLISWRGYWQELIETLAWAHERTPLANLIRWRDKPVAQNGYTNIISLSSSIAQVGLMYVLGCPHQKATIQLSFVQACFHLLEPILWNVLFVMTFVTAFVSIVKLIRSWAFRVPIILLLCLNFLYGLFKYVNAASMFNVLCYSYRMNGVLFVSLGFLVLCCFILVLWCLCVFFVETSKPNRGGVM
ncbi:uncharacterized protein [Medicago truncatula]|nr:uncharacterized protein LOC11425777 [Medicago truncatula]AES67868.2 photosystem I P700 chlorophyll A apoprotein [Medicago truncatula]